MVSLVDIMSTLQTIDKSEKNFGYATYIQGNKGEPVQGNKGEPVAFQSRAYITDLARVRSLAFITSGEKPQDVATTVIGDVEIFVAMAMDMDLEGEARRLEKEIRKVEKNMEIVTRKLSNDEFISKAPAEVVEKVKAKREALLIREKKLRGSLGEILKIQQSAPAEEGPKAGG